MTHQPRRHPARTRISCAVLSGALAVAVTACGLIAPDGGIDTTAVTGGGHVAASAVAAPVRPAAGLDGPWRVVGVTDGDTIRVTRTDDGRGAVVKVRLLSVDAPETVDPRIPTPQCYGPQASANLKQKPTARTIDLEHGPEERDRYGRTLAYVWLGGELVNLSLVAGGYAREYTYDRSQPGQYSAAIRAAQADARTAGRGLWAPAGCNGTTDRTVGVPR